MKRIVGILLIEALLAFSLTACGNSGSDHISESVPEQSQKTDSKSSQTDSDTESTEQAEEPMQTMETAETEEAVNEQPEGTQFLIEIGGLSLAAELYDTQLAEDFAKLLPQTISMQRVGGGREFYGGIDGSLNYDETEARTTFENGDIAYWFSGNGLCLLYDNQVENPEVSSGIIIIGRITSDFSELHNIDDQATATISLVNEET